MGKTLEKIVCALEDGVAAKVVKAASYMRYYPNYASKLGYDSRKNPVFSAENEMSTIGFSCLEGIAYSLVAFPLVGSVSAVAIPATLLGRVVQYVYSLRRTNTSH